MRTLFLDWFHWCFVLEVSNYIASKELPFKGFFLLDSTPGHPEPHEFNTEGIEVIATSKYNIYNSSSRSGSHRDHYGSLHVVLYVKDYQCYGRELHGKIMEIWKDYTIEDAIIIGKAVKTVKPKAINSCWRKLCPDVVYDFTGYTTEPVKEIMKDILDNGKKAGGEGGQLPPSTFLPSAWVFQNRMMNDLFKWIYFSAWMGAWSEFLKIYWNTFSLCFLYCFTEG